jgi:hypothetical protein
VYLTDLYRLSQCLEVGRREASPSAVIGWRRLMIRGAQRCAREGIGRGGAPNTRGAASCRSRSCAGGDGGTPPQAATAWRAGARSRRRTELAIAARSWAA